MGFAALPAELQLRVITESIKPQTSSPSPHQGIQQALTLALVSRSCNATVTEWLYRDIRVCSPSSLQQLHDTLSTRPDLCNLVRSIHIGPDAELPNYGWPLKRLGPQGLERAIATSLLKPSHEALLPAWCAPGSVFRLICPTVKDCQGFAIFNALKAAMEDLDVRPSRERYSHSGHCIGLRAWSPRVFLLQAALDVYLMEMRCLDNERVADEPPPKRVGGGQKTPKACKDSTCGHYPSLKVLHAAPPSASSSDASVLAVTVAQLWQHLEKPGGPCDDFDSAILLARSKGSALGLYGREWGYVFLRLAGSLIGRFSDDFENGINQDSGDDRIPDSLTLDESSSGSSGATVIRPSRKVEDLLEIARSVLRLTPCVTNLSLSSWLYLALSAVPNPSTLRSLSLGSLPHWQDLVFPKLAMASMKSLLRLRVVGQIKAPDGAILCRELPMLEELEWVNPYACHPDAWDVISELQGRRLSIDSAEETQHSTSESDGSPDPTVSSEASTRGSAPSQKYSLPYRSSSTAARRRTYVLVRPRDCERAFSRASGDPAVGEAWTRGDPVAGTVHRVKVSQIGPPQPDISEEGLQEVAELRAQLYAEGREWWERGHADVGSYDGRG